MPNNSLPTYYGQNIQ